MLLLVVRCLPSKYSYVLIKLFDFQYYIDYQRGMVCCVSVVWLCEEDQFFD